MTTLHKKISLILAPLLILLLVCLCLLLTRHKAEQMAGDTLSHAEKLFSDGKIEEALDLYETAQFETPSQAAKAQFMVGICYERLNEIEKARKAYDSLIYNYPDEKELVGKALERQVSDRFTVKTKGPIMAYAGGPPRVGSIRGKVLVNGQPWENITVLIEPLPNEAQVTKAQRRSRKAYTNSKGEFFVDDLWEGTYRVEAFKPTGINGLTQFFPEEAQVKSQKQVDLGTLNLEDLLIISPKANEEIETTEPTFQWDLPTSWANHRIDISVHRVIKKDPAGNTMVEDVWSVEDVKTAHVKFNYDGTASQSLISGETYQCEIILKTDRGADAYSVEFKIKA